MIDWNVFLAPAAVLLVIPLAIIPAFGRPTGSIIVSGTLGTAAFAVFWLALGGVDGFGQNMPVSMVVMYGGMLITLVAWALALNGAAQARRWVWVALLFVAGYATAAAIYASFSLQTCFGPAFACPPPDPLKQALVIAGYLACPVAALVFGILPLTRRTRQPLEELVISSLYAAPSSDAPDSHE